MYTYTYTGWINCGLFCYCPGRVKWQEEWVAERGGHWKLLVRLGGRCDGWGILVPAGWRLGADRKEIVCILTPLLVAPPAGSSLVVQNRVVNYARP